MDSTSTQPSKPPAQRVDVNAEKRARKAQEKADRTGKARAAKAEPVPHGKKPFPMIAAHAAEEAVAADPQAGSIRLTLDGRLQASLETLATERAAAAGASSSASTSSAWARGGSRGVVVMAL